MKTLICNSLWYASCLPSVYKWQKAILDPTTFQENILLDVLNKNKDSLYGKYFDFKSIRSIQQYQRQVPIVDYDDLKPFVEEIGKFSGPILTNEPIILFEPTSGSTNATKLIPFTPSLQGSIQKAISPWIESLYRGNKKMFCGKSYWSITPPALKDSKHNGIPICFATDSEYLGGLQKSLINSIMAVPSEVAEIEDVETFKYVTALFLLAETNLTFISVWNPAFLFLILEKIYKELDSLLSNIERGKISGNVRMNNRLKSKLEKKIYPDPQRADLIKSVLSKISCFKNIKSNNAFEKIWPNLCALSAWGDAWADSTFLEMQQYFPKTFCQKKGLIATEGVVSIPIIDRYGSALAITSSFFEFRELNTDSPKNIYTANEIIPGKRYEIIITTYGGLYRYLLGDIIEVVDYLDNCPLIRFLGRGNLVVDMYGEKLHENHVKSVIDLIFKKFEINPTFWLVAPENKDSISGHYTLFIQTAEEKDFASNWTTALKEEMDLELSKNIHYGYCRKIGQLGPLRIFLVNPEINAQEIFVSFCCKTGQRLGNIKNQNLHPDKHWSKRFLGKYI